MVDSALYATHDIEWTKKAKRGPIGGVAWQLSTIKFLDDIPLKRFLSEMLVSASVPCRRSWDCWHALRGIHPTLPTCFALLHPFQQVHN